MKAGIHPDYTLANVHCSFGNQFYTRSTSDDLHVELCSECHPFYTGKQKLVDTGGRVERFQRRYAKQQAEQAAAVKEREASRRPTVSVPQHPGAPPTAETEQG